jgi:hypothetical protein
LQKQLYFFALFYLHSKWQLVVSKRNLEINAELENY